MENVAIVSKPIAKYVPSSHSIIETEKHRKKNWRLHHKAQLQNEKACVQSSKLSLVTVVFLSCRVPAMFHQSVSRMFMCRTGSSTVYPSPRFHSSALGICSACALMYLIWELHCICVVKNRYTMTEERILTINYWSAKQFHWYLRL